MNLSNESIITVCATCLSLHRKNSTNLPVTDDIKEILRCLLHGFDIDAFFQLKPPDKQLMLCEKCHHTIRHMISFKECALNSFKQFMKYWCGNTKKITRYKVSGPSSSHTSTGALLHVKEIDPLDSSYTEPDPSQIKQETEYIENIIEIEVKTDIIDVKNETNNLNANVLNEPEPVIPLKREQELTMESNKLTNELINSSVTPALYSAVRDRNNLVINKVTASNVSQQSSYHNAATKLHNLKHTNNFVINKVPSANASKNSSNNKLVKRITVYPDNQNRNNFARVVNQGNNLNVGNYNSNVSSTAANIHSNLLVKESSSENLTNKTSAHTNADSNIRITNISHTNNTAIANIHYLSHIFKTKNDNLFKRISVKDGKPLAQNSRKKLKIVKIYYKGNIKYVGEAMIKPITESAEDKLTAQVSSVPDPNITQAVEDGCEIPEADTSATEPEEEIGQNEPSSAVKNWENINKKWYIKIVTRDEILKKMEERRNEPKFVNAPYKCESCVNLFPTESLAEAHKKSVHAEDCEFTCFACHATFKKLITMNAHYYEHLKDICMYYCITCDFETKHAELVQDHICPNAGCPPLPPKDPETMKLTRLKSLYYCPNCEYMSIRGPSLVLHYNNVHKDNPKVKCKQCGKFYKNKHALRCHRNNMHRGKWKQVGDPSYCSKCDKWFTCKYSYGNHMKNKHTPNGRKFKCAECEKVLLSKKSVQDHEEFHAAVRAEVKNHICSTCGKAYYTERLLQRHVRRSHENKPTSRDHVCEVCGKGFFTRSMLKYHSAMHSDERPLKCSFCEDTFKYSGAFYTHIKLKHKTEKNGEDLRNERKTEIKDSSKGKGQMKDRSKRRKRVESSNSEKELVSFTGS